MAFIDEVKKTAEEVIQRGAGWAQLGVNKASQMGSIAKLKAANQAEENNIRKAYTELGKRYYVAHSADAGAEFADVLQQIEEAKARIQANNTKITELREKADAPSEDIIFEMDVNDLPTEPVAEEAAPAEPVQPAAESEAPAVEPIQEVRDELKDAIDELKSENE